MKENEVHENSYAIGRICNKDFYNLTFSLDSIIIKPINQKGELEAQIIEELGT